MSDWLTNWHIDKRVPIVLIVTLLLQAGGAIWWASGVTEQLAQHASLISELKLNEIARIADERELYMKIAKQEIQLDNISNALRRIEGVLRGSSFSPSGVEVPHR